MTVYNPTAGTIYTKVRVVGRPVLHRVTDDADQSLPRPIDLTSFVPEDGMIVNGYKMVPKVWVRGKAVATTDGSFIDSARLRPTELQVDCHSRFLAGSDFYDDVAGVWRPFYTRGVDWYWITDPACKPTYMDLEYRINKEILTFDVLNFQDQDYLRSSFNTDMDDAAEYTVVMVASFDNPTGYVGMSTPQRNFLVNEKFTLQEVNTSTISTAAHPAQIDPAIVIISVRPTTTRVWIASPDNKVAVGTAIALPGSQDMIFQLGRKLGDITGGANMKLMEWTLLDYAVQSTGTTGQYNVNQIISLYSSVYGAR